jgi:nucleoside triphosphate pyrophosphatase
MRCALEFRNAEFRLKIKAFPLTFPSFPQLFHVEQLWKSHFGAPIAKVLCLHYKSTMLVLASASPRRQELLRNAGIPFRALAAGVPEVPRPGEPPLDYAQRLARSKARAVARQLTSEPGNWVLGADTIVVVDGHILEKPAGAADAARMLRLLSGRTHQVTTGVCLLGDGFEDTRAETTEVTFDRLREDEISMYVAHGEPMDKAGAYAIQGIASRWICRLDGCYFNVVGLPVPLVYRMLREHGWNNGGTGL